jgi:nickel-type superoxide dismutase maturation protease
VNEEELVISKVLVIIIGDSMWPTLRAGDEVEFTELVAQDNAELRVGDLVVAIHPLKPGVQVVKRIAGFDADARLILVGDNPDPLASEDSHNFGPVSAKSIIAYRRSLSTGEGV